MVNKLQILVCKCLIEDDCLRDYDLVCGSDGKIYINLCRMGVEVCIIGQLFRMIKKGVCGKVEILLS